MWLVYYGCVHGCFLFANENAFSSFFLPYNLVSLSLSVFIFLLLCELMRFARGSPSSVLLAFSQSYIKHNLRKNKIVVPPPPFFISTKFRMIKSILGDTILKGLTFYT